MASGIERPRFRAILVVNITNTSQCINQNNTIPNAMADGFEAFVAPDSAKLDDILLW